MSGRFSNGVHEMPVRVYYEDTDLSGFVYHANYLRFAERGRSDFLYHCGVDHDVLKSGTPETVFVVASMDIAFKMPAKINDLLTVRTVYTKAKGARFEISQKILRGDELVWMADIVAASVTLDGRPVRLPDAMMRLVTDRLGNKDLI
ncbi:MAG: YbgC/FadM family acyl-CoA thioesterase [Parvibaculales bacterium]